jgi:class 3 adenylate cyclase/Flp pilus assembly protein TadD
VSEDATERVKRRLAAIMFAGYTRLVPGDEASSFAGLARLRTEVIEPQILKFGGHLIRWTGDEVLIEFESVVEAVRCAAALGEAVSRYNQTQVPDRRVVLRAGINLDDIIVEDGDVFGDGVNIAARLEALAEPGSVYVSEIVRDRVAGKLDFDFVDLGLKDLKNISRPIRVYRIGGEVSKGSSALDSAGAVSAASPAGHWPSHSGREIRSRPHRPVRIAGRNHPHYRGCAGAGTPQIRTQPHRQPTATQLGCLRTLSRGVFHHYRQNKADNIEAQAYFRRALTIDAQYPQAIAVLSTSVSSAASLGWADNADARFEDAYVLAQQAVALDPRYPNAHFALGVVCMRTRRSERGIAAFEEAIRLNPSFAAAHVLLGQMYLYAGRRQEAIGQAEKGIRLSPSDPRLFIWLPALAGAHYQMRHYAEAIEAGRRSWSLNRNWPHGLRYVVAGLAQLGRIEEAQAALAELKLMQANLEFSASVFRRNWPDPADIDHLLDGLRKAGFK